MSFEVDISPDMQRRVAAIAKWSGRSASQIIADALENGHSLDWQEKFIAKISAGIAAADRGDFASDQDIERVRNKHRPA